MTIYPKLLNFNVIYPQIKVLFYIKSYKNTIINYVYFLRFCVVLTLVAIFYSLISFIGDQ